MNGQAQEELLREVERRIALLSALEAEWEASCQFAAEPAKPQGRLPLAGELTALRDFWEAAPPRRGGNPSKTQRSDTNGTKQSSDLA